MPNPDGLGSRYGRHPYRTYCQQGAAPRTARSWERQRTGAERERDGGQRDIASLASMAGQAVVMAALPIRGRRVRCHQARRRPRHRPRHRGAPPAASLSRAGPQQDSNSRTRLRRGVTQIAPASRNAPRCQHLGRAWYAAPLSAGLPGGDSALCGGDVVGPQAGSCRGAGPVSGCRICAGSLRHPCLRRGLGLRDERKHGRTCRLADVKAWLFLLVAGDCHGA